MGRSVRACFYVEAITKRVSGQGAADVTLRASTAGERGKEWSKWTPNGELTLRSMSDGATLFFEDVMARALVPGQKPEVYLTIEIADEVDARG